MKNNTTNKIEQITPTFTKGTMEKLIPVLSKKEKQEIFAYYTVYEKYEEEFSKKATEDLINHPVFGELIRDIPKEVSTANGKLSRELQKDAIINDNWEPYIEYQIKQGITYAKMGLDFKSWYEVVSLVRNYITPYLQKEYGIGAKLISSLNGMNRFLDIAMGIIGEAYLQEKEGIIKEDREKIKKLNQELEQRVVQRTAQLESVNRKLESEITQRRNAEESRMDSEHRYRSLFESMDEGFCVAEMIYDSNGKAVDYRFIEVNPMFEKHTGLIEAKGKTIREMVPNHDAHWFEIYGNVARTGEAIRFENPADAMHRYYDVFAFRIGGDGSPNVGILFKDITEEKKYEESLQKLNLSLETSNKELEAFSYSVSHDLRGPLRAIDGFSRILLQDYMNILDDEGKRLLSVVSNNTRKMGQLIDDMLSFSRVGRKEIGLSEINMEKLTKDVLNELNPDTIERKIEIVVKPLPNAYADVSMIRQVLINLLSNAIKFTKPRAGALIEVGSDTSVSSDKKGTSGFAENIYYVKDNGVGFDMKYANKLFGVFQRLHGVDEFDGTGIGLAIVKRVIERHGGRVWAEGKINEGAMFYFALPINSSKKII